MNGRITHWLARKFGREACVPINRCVHFCGFRYGIGAYHPYESYVAALAKGNERAAARDELIDFLRGYRPRHFGEALGLELSREYPLWLYPWSRRRPPPAWRSRVDECPDILTHFVSAGVARTRIEREFGWLEAALGSIQRHGFRPELFRSPILARKLVGEDGETAWLLLDGNHRVAALAALGEQSVRVRHLPLTTVRETGLMHWPQVRNGVYTPADARRVFRVHFDGNRRPRTTTESAAVLEGEA